jgi:hypothetical protein
VPVTDDEAAGSCSEAIVETIEAPSAAPSSCPVVSSPDAEPAVSSAISDMAATVIAAKARPMLNPISEKPGSSSVR